MLTGQQERGKYLVASCLCNDVIKATLPPSASPGFSRQGKGFRSWNLSILAEALPRKNGFWLIKERTFRNLQSHSPGLKLVRSRTRRLHIHNYRLPCVREAFMKVPFFRALRAYTKIEWKFWYFSPGKTPYGGSAGVTEGFKFFLRTSKKHASSSVYPLCARAPSEAKSGAVLRALNASVP